MGHLCGALRFKIERRLLPCDDFFIGMSLFWKPPCCLIQLSRCDQVLTGIQPYRGSNVEDMITDIHAGKRPSRPINPSGDRWLSDQVWDMITVGWNQSPDQRCKLSVMSHVLSSWFSREEVRHDTPGQSNVQNDGSLTITKTSQIPKRQPWKILPRITSFFQSLQNPESEIQRRVNEIDEVSFSVSPPSHYG